MAVSLKINWFSWLASHHDRYERCRIHEMANFNFLHLSTSVVRLKSPGTSVLPRKRPSHKTDVNNDVTDLSDSKQASRIL